MFKRNRTADLRMGENKTNTASEIESPHTAGQPEWEEYVVSADEQNKYVVPEKVPEHVVNHLEEYAEAFGDSTVPSEYNSADEQEIDVHEAIIDTTAFPAIRLAYGLDDSVEPIEEEQSKREWITAELDEDEWRMELIRHYAEMEDEEMGNIPSEDLPQEDNLPQLFRVSSLPGQKVNTTETEESQSDEFTMESELDLLRTISGELFSYIDTIEQDARSLIRQRELDREAAARPKKIDPYNLHFNNRYDDLEEVLSNTPEIPLEPKFKMEN